MSVRRLCLPFLLLPAACAVVPSSPPSVVDAVPENRWVHRAAGGGADEAALWGPADTGALLMIHCTRAGAELVVEGDDRPTGPWRLAVGRERMTLDPMHERDGMATETATIPPDHPMLAALAATGGPLRLSTASYESDMPASPIVGTVVGKCRGPRAGR